MYKPLGSILLAALAVVFSPSVRAQRAKATLVESELRDRCSRRRFLTSVLLSPAVILHIILTVLFTRDFARRELR